MLSARSTGADVVRVDGDLHAGALLLQHHADAAVAPAQPRPSASVISSSARLVRRIGTPTSRPAGRRAKRPCAAAAARSRPARSWPVQEVLGHAVEGARTSAGALADRLPQRQRIDAGLHAHGEHLGERDVDRCSPARLCTSLATEPAPIGADVARLVAHRVEHRFVLVEHRLVAAHPDRQLARCSRPRGPPLTGHRADATPCRPTARAARAPRLTELVDRSNQRRALAEAVRAGRSRRRRPPPHRAARAAR